MTLQFKSRRTYRNTAFRKFKTSSFQDPIIYFYYKV